MFILSVYFAAKSSDLVSCGSVLKLYNIDYKVRLHSHDVKYGSGSGQQSVTGITIPEDINSHWAVKAPTGQHCTRGSVASHLFLPFVVLSTTIDRYTLEMRSNVAMPSDCNM